MKKIFLAVCLILVILLTFVTTASANFLIIGNDETYVLDYDETYDLVRVEEQGTLVVNNGATLTVTGCLVGRHDSSFLFDNCTVSGRINIESSKSFMR